MRISLLSIFPEYFQSPFKSSILGRALEAGLLKIDFVPLRNFGEGKYRSVDDKPYGGGVGMVMMPQVIEKALATLMDVDQLEEDVKAFRKSGQHASAVPHVIFFTPQGRKLDAKFAKELSRHEHLVLVCGHYEGVDERAFEAFAHEEVSIGDYVLTGGEPAAAVLVDAISRFIPGVVGDAVSVEGDTFGSSRELIEGGLKAPVFTRPAKWRERAIPEVLASGHHGKITEWRKAQSQSRTEARRPELLRTVEASKEAKSLKKLAKPKSKVVSKRNPKSKRA